MEDVFALNRLVARSLSLQRAARDPSPAEKAEAIVAALDAGSGLGLDQDLRHLAGQVARQARLPRDGQRDHRFFQHLEWALRDLAVRPVEPTTRRPSTDHDRSSL